LDPKLLRDADAYARACHTTRSGVVARALRELLERVLADEITRQLNEVYADPVNRPTDEDLDAMLRLSVEALEASDSRLVIRQGDVYWLDQGVPFGSEPGLRRPWVVIQSDAFNRGNIRTVVACAVTSNLRLAAAPGNVALPAGQANLPRKASSTSRRS
jgi:mRNA-degrading endonuclease toxin of MazEF toxin-antitoxin module